MAKILLIEDDTALRRDTAEMLEFEGHETMQAGNGRIGVQIARESRPDLIICDIMMPELDGYGVLAELQKDGAGVTTPFIFLTAKTDKVDIRAGMSSGADDYVTKPFTVDELIASVRKRLEKRERVANISDERLNSLRNNVIVALPHELRTPLTGILGFSDLLRTDYESIDANQGIEMANQIYQSALRLYRLTENYMTYTTIELIAGDATRVQALRMAKTENWVDIIETQANTNAQQANRERDLTIMIPSGAGVLQISQESLQKIVDELTSNAFKFSNAGTPVAVSGTLDNKQMLLEITDHGRGLKEHEIANLGAFMQYDRRLYEQTGGGLGLTIVKRLVELHDGTFSIESVLGEFTTVSVRLPVELLPVSQKIHKTLVSKPKSDSEAVLRISDFDNFRDRIAVSCPRCIVLDNPNYMKMITDLRNFSLSATTPIVVIGETLPPVTEWPAIYDAGADEICTADEQSLKQAVETATRQYQRPILTGSELLSWQVVVCIKDPSLQEIVLSALYTNYTVEVTCIEDNKDFTQAFSGMQPDLVIIEGGFADLAGFKVVESLRALKIETPAVLLVSDEEINKFQQRIYELNVRGVLGKAVTESDLISLIERLLRKEIPIDLSNTLYECVRKTTALEFEVMLREQVPLVADMVHESTVRNSGLIHDIRNSLTSLILRLTKADSSEEKAKLLTGSQYCRLLVEVIAEARFKGSWNPEIVDGAPEFLGELIKQSFSIAQYICPKHTFQFKNTIKDSGKILLDKARITNAITSLLLVCARIKSEGAIEVELYPSADGSETTILSISSVSWQEKDLQPLVSLDSILVNSFSFVLMLMVQKGALMHGGHLSVNKNRLIWSFPNFEITSDEQFRSQIANLANAENAFVDRLTFLPPFVTKTQVNTAFLIGGVAFEVLNEFERMREKVNQSNQQDHSIEIILRYASLLVRDMLISNAGINLNLKEVPLQQLFTTLFELRKDFLEAVEAAFEVHPKGLAVKADELAMLQILVNLVTNAVEAMESCENRGRLQIEATENRDVVQITVSDSGHGMSEDQLAKIFDLHFTTKEGHERGIGLFVVDSIVKQLNGTIHVDSRLGEGTAFTITLPPV